MVDYKLFKRTNQLFAVVVAAAVAVGVHKIPFKYATLDVRI